MPGRSIAAVVLSLGLMACREGEADPPEVLTPTLVPAVDLDPDPTVVEVDLIAEPGEVELLPGVETAVLGYRDGGRPEAGVTIPGPLIEAQRGDRLIVHFHNRSERPTTLHWHGLRLPVEMDGNPMVSGAVAPGADAEIEFVLNDPGTFWYHPHVDVDEQVELGLHGQLVVRDPADPEVATDRVFELDDIQLDDDGQIVLAPSTLDLMLGRRGNVLLVNGAPPATLELAAGAVERWRLVNAANGRLFRVALRREGSEPDPPMAVIGWDAGRIDAPYTVDELLIAPGERYELLLSFAGEPGETWVLETLPVDRGEGRLDEGPYDLVRIRLGPSVAGPEPSPEDFASLVAPIEVGAQTPSRAISLSEDSKPGFEPVFFINDQLWPQNTPIEVELGTTEIWEVENLSPGWHPLHIHGLYFEILEINGVSPPARGLEDTVAIPGEGTAKLAVRYTAPGMWMFHCTIKEHAERGMMGDLLVTSP